MLRLQFIGGGNMGEALLTGLIKNRWAQPPELGVVEMMEPRRQVLQQIFPEAQIGDSPTPEVDVVLAVKPDDVVSACQSLEGLKIDRVLSIAAGTRIATLEEALGPHVRIIRAMPNTPATLGEAASAIAGSSNSTEEDLVWAEEILTSVGTVVRLTEDLLDAVTGLSGSGPAYVFYLAEALIAAGIEAGLPAEIANSLVVQTLLGSAQMLSQTDTSPAELRRRVTSPKGTTQKGIEVLDEAGVKATFVEAVRQATERAAEIATEITNENS